jgi:hypothetical protein
MNRVALAIPARDHMDTMTAFDFASAVGWHCSMFPNDVLIPLVSMGTLLVSQRNELVNLAQKENATHILFIDSDMRFPADLFSRMLSRNVDVVAANCPKRRMPIGPTAGNWDPETKRKITVFTRPESTGLEVVDMVGTGVMLCRMDVFDRIEKPWFATPWVPEANNYQGEDVYFCKLLKKAGIDVHIDHDISKQIGHIGSLAYKHEHIWHLEGMDPTEVREPMIEVIA